MSVIKWHLTEQEWHLTELKWHFFEIKWHFTVVKCHSDRVAVIQLFHRTSTTIYIYSP